MKRKDNLSENFLDRIPIQTDEIDWTTDENGIVTLEIENKGFVNRIAQKLLKKPKISYIHLDEMGSFIWPILDGQKSVFELGKEVEEHFGENAQPLYERLIKYLKILESYGFISFLKNIGVH